MSLLNHPGMGGFLGLALAGIFLCGCVNAPRRTQAPGPESTRPTPDAAEGVGRADLWARTCSRCHYARGPETFSPEQWETIMLHMRVRANLTTAEHQTILDFLTPAN